METVSLPIPIFTIIYNGKDITHGLQPYLINLTYDDTVQGESDQIEITLENEDGLWSNGWYPNKGDTIDCSIGQMDCGTFQVDEIELNGPPDTVVIRALTTIIDKDLKTKKTKSHSNKTLLQIAQATAQHSNLTLVGTGNIPSVLIEHVTQKRLTDLKFLRKCADKYGCIFSVKNTKLIFTSMYDLENKPPSISVDKTQMIDYSIKDKTSETYKSAELRHHNPKSSQLITSKSQIKTVQNNEGVSYTEITPGDTLLVHRRVENQQQADEAVKSSLYRANSKQQTGTINMQGTELVVAGNNMEITGLGYVGSGIWHMMKSKHKVDRQNSWLVGVDIKRVAAVSVAKQQSSGVKSGKPEQSKVIVLQNKNNVSYSKIVVGFSGKQISAADKSLLTLIYNVLVDSGKGYVAKTLSYNQAESQYNSANKYAGRLSAQISEESQYIAGRLFNIYNEDIFGSISDYREQSQVSADIGSLQEYINKLLDGKPIDSSPALPGAGSFTPIN